MCLTDYWNHVISSYVVLFMGVVTIPFIYLNRSCFLSIHHTSTSNPYLRMAMTTTPVHLILLIHGLYGHPSNLKYVVEQLRKTIPRIKDGLPVELHVTESFTGSKSWDGIDYCAERTAVEVSRRGFAPPPLLSVSKNS